jgi:hypothetical protein
MRKPIRVVCEQLSDRRTPRLRAAAGLHRTNPCVDLQGYKSNPHIIGELVLLPPRPGDRLLLPRKLAHFGLTYSSDRVLSDDILEWLGRIRERSDDSYFLCLMAARILCTAAHPNEREFALSAVVAPVVTDNGGASGPTPAGFFRLAAARSSLLLVVGLLACYRLMRMSCRVGPFNELAII